MLSFIGQDLASQIRPIYDPTVGYEEVFRDVFLSFTSLVKRLDLLCDCEEKSRNHPEPSWVPDWSVNSLAERIYPHSFMSGFSSSQARITTPSTLQVDGVHIATIQNVMLQMPFDDDDILMMMKRKWWPQLLLTRQYLIDEALLDAYAATLRTNNLGEQWLDEPTQTMEEWKAALLGVLSRQPAEGQDTNRTNDWNLYLCSESLQNKFLFETNDSYLGIGSPSALPEDQVCVLLGCPSAMLLRPLPSPTTQGFKVVGECYVHVLDDGVALLGPLLPKWRV